MYSIELLLAQIEELDNEKCSLQRTIKRYKKKMKKLLLFLNINYYDVTFSSSRLSIISMFVSDFVIS